jgi:hypothetical protein
MQETVRVKNRTGAHGERKREGASTTKEDSHPAGSSRGEERKRK